MILGFRHRGIERLFEKGNCRRLLPGQVATAERILARLDEAEVPGDMDLPGFGLDPLKGYLGGIRQSGCPATGVSSFALTAATSGMWT